MQKIRISHQAFLLILSTMLSGCGNSPNVLVNELSKNTVSYDETIHINNCGGKADSEQIASRTFATTIEGRAEFSAGYQSIVEGGISAKYSQYRNVSKSQRLIAPPATNMEFILRWSEDVHSGNVTVNGATGNYEVRVPISVEQVSSQDLGCSGNTQIQPEFPTSTLLPTSTALSSGADLTSCPSMPGHLGAGQGFSVTLQKGCHYHFNVACSGCPANVENNYIIYYAGESGDMISVTVPEGSVWRYDRVPATGEVCEAQDFYPTELPSFLSLSGVQLLRICD